MHNKKSPLEIPEGIFVLVLQHLGEERFQTGMLGVGAISGQEYGQLAEGDRGTLHFQGTRYLGFDRR